MSEKSDSNNISPENGEKRMSIDDLKIEFDLEKLRAEFDRVISAMKYKGYVDLGLGSVRIPQNPTEDAEDNERRWLKGVLSMLICNDNGDYEELFVATPDGEVLTPLGKYSDLDTPVLRLVFQAYMDYEKEKGLTGFSFTRNEENYKDASSEEAERKDMIAIMSMHDCYLMGKSTLISRTTPAKFRFVEKPGAIDVTDSIR